jgi:hypothetical protein
MRAEVKSILSKLEAVKEKVEDYLSNAEDAEHPNDERIDRLTNEVEYLEQAIEALEGIE